jgi:SAM-dependent methyltransferase
MLSWTEEDLFVVAETRFRILAEIGFEGAKAPDMEGADFLVAKPRWLVDRYVSLLERVRPLYIFELGFFQGGSTAMLLELARPRRLVAIDRTHKRPGATKPIEDFAERRGLADAVVVHGGVDQGDRARLAEIVDQDFAGETLDLVIDDCSHRYEETRASFNELFPRLRAGGTYVIEDWPWAHSPVGTEPLEGFYPDQVPLSRLVFELVLALPGMPGLIDELTLDRGMVVVTRGPLEIDREGFDVSACSNPRGRELLAPLPGGR